VGAGKCLTIKCRKQSRLYKKLFDRKTRIVKTEPKSKADTNERNTKDTNGVLKQILDKMEDKPNQQEEVKEEQ
jgi:cell division protein FtsN